MGHTIWVLPEGAEEDDWDHSLVLIQEKSLDKLSSSLGVKKLSEFFDFSILAEEYGGDTDPLYVEPAEVEATLVALADAIKSGTGGNLERRDELLEELEDMRSKVRKAGNNGVRVRVSIVP